MESLGTEARGEKARTMNCYNHAILTRKYIILSFPKKNRQIIKKEVNIHETNSNEIQRKKLTGF